MNSKTGFEYVEPRDKEMWDAGPLDLSDNLN